MSARRPWSCRPRGPLRLPTSSSRLRHIRRPGSRGATEFDGHPLAQPAREEPMCRRHRATDTTAAAAGSPEPFPSPIPTHTRLGEAWLIATEPMSALGWSSKTERHVWPPFRDFQSPPEAAPTKMTFGSETTASIAEIRPVPPAGPMLRADIPSNRSALTCPMAGSATGIANRHSARRSTRDVDVSFITASCSSNKGPRSPFKRRERGLCPR